MRYGSFHHDSGFTWVHLLGWLLPLLFIGGLVALVVVLLTRDRHPGLHAATVGDGAHAALRLRYARGEISRDEYYEAMRDLTQPTTGWTPPASPTPPAPPAAPPSASPTPEPPATPGTESPPEA